MSRAHRPAFLTRRFAPLLFLLVALGTSVAAQQPSAPLPSPVPYEPLTRLEALDTQVGAVVVKNYTYIGSVTSPRGVAMVTSYEFVDAQTGRKDYGIGVEVREIEKTEKPEREAATFVDYEEIDALLRAIDYISRIDKSSSMENFEAEYRTRGELGVSTFIRPNGTLQAAVSIGLFRRTEMTISLGKLADFRKLIADAKTTLDKIR